MSRPSERHLRGYDSFAELMRDAGGQTWRWGMWVLVRDHGGARWWCRVDEIGGVRGKGTEPRYRRLGYYVRNVPRYRDADVPKRQRAAARRALGLRSIATPPPAVEVDP